MAKSENLHAFSELYNLINYYYEHRDHPIPKGINLSNEFEHYCKLLDLDFDAFKKEFKIFTDSIFDEEK